MCGIIGFVGNGEAQKIVPECLKGLEYRGYDSCGLAFLSGKKIISFKNTGTVSKLIKNNSLPSCSTGIGHTRWATHGHVSKENSHPHFSCGKDIAVVHNGIIENFSSLKKELLKKNHRFSSQTDSEVIAHLIEEFMSKGNNFLHSVSKTVRRLEGSFAFLAVSCEFPGTIIAVKKDSPLILGVAEKGFFASSDQTPLLAFTNKFVFLDDFDLAVLTKDSFKCFNALSLSPAKKRANEIKASFTSSGKLKCSHFMLKEIMEQPQAVVSACGQEKPLLLKLKKLVEGKKIAFVANGTSLHASMVSANFFREFNGIEAECFNASEFAFECDKLNKNSVIIAVSQSGETADVLHSVRAAKNYGFKIISLVNVFGSSLARMSDKTVYLNCGTEIGVASTKSFAAQISALYLISKTFEGKFNEAKKQLLAVSKNIAQTIKLNKRKALNLSKIISKKNHVYFIGRAQNFAVALEGALKLKEISYIHAEALLAGELKHGTLALISRKTPVIAVMPSDEFYSRTLGNAIETKARGAFLIGVSDKGNSVFDFSFDVPSVPSMLFPLVLVPSLQLLSFYSALNLNHNPDRPRNLAKSVTVL